MSNSNTNPDRLKTIAMRVARRAQKRAPEGEPWEDVAVAHLDIGEILEVVGPDDCDILTPDAERYLVSLPASAAARLGAAEAAAGDLKRAGGAK